MASYLFGKRPKMDQTLMSRDTVKKLGTGGKEYRVADAFLKEHPELKSVFNRHSERQALGKEIYQAGGGTVSKSKDRFGYTEGDFIKTLEDMRKSGALNRKETIHAAEKTLKSTGHYKREYVKELYEFDSNKKSPEQSPQAGSTSTASKPKRFGSSFIARRTAAVDNYFGKSFVSGLNRKTSQSSRQDPISPSISGHGAGPRPIPSKFKAGGNSFPRLFK